MKKLIMWNVVTVDGYFQGVEPWDLGFHKSIWGDELEKFSIEQLDSADAIIYGADTYTGMAAYWDKQEGEIADRLNVIKKYACSKSLASTEWNNTEILRDAVTEITAIKQKGEGNLFVFGSGKLSDSLMKAGLFDEYRLCIAPVILGEGRRLFENGLPSAEFSLLEYRPVAKDGLLVRYSAKN